MRFKICITKAKLDPKLIDTQQNSIRNIYRTNPIIDMSEIKLK